MKTGSPPSTEAINLLKPASQLAFFYGCLLSVFQLTFSTSTFHACCFVLTLRWELQVRRGLKAGICFIDAFALPAGGQVPRFLVLLLSPPLSQPRQWWPAKLTHGSFVNFPDGPGQKVEEGGRSCQRGLDQQPTQLSAPPK